MPLNIHCCGCNKEVSARITDGEEIYPHREDLHTKAFFVCDTCENFVGCHPNTCKPLGVIPTPELRIARTGIHQLLDPIWQSKRYTRTEVYKRLSEELGYKYHTANITSDDEAKKSILAIRKLFY